MSRPSPRRRRSAPAPAITPRHVWLATLGLAARSRRQALQLGEQAQQNVTLWRAAIGSRVVGVDQVLREGGERLESEFRARVQPLLARAGLHLPKPAAKRKPAARKSVRKAAPRRVAARKAASRRA